MDLFTNTQLLASQDINWWTGVVWITCGLLWCFYQLFGLSFWRHPFTAEDPLVSEWWNATFLQLWWRNKLIYILDDLRWAHFQQIFIFAWTISLRVFPNSSPFHFRHLIFPLRLHLDGPDMPVLKVSPTKAVFVSGESLFLSCQAEGEPPPSTTWFFNGESIATSSTGTVSFTNVKTSQSGIYTCVMMNTRTEATLQRNVTIIVYGMSL